VAQRLGTGVFVIRAWYEDEQFRARVSYRFVADAEAPAAAEVLTADPDEVRRHLELWLGQAATGRSPDDPGRV
jgi:hypothetical protein